MIRSMLKTGVLGVCTLYAYTAGKRRSPVVLMYHSFDTQNWKHGVHPKELAKQIEFLVRKCTVVPLTDIVAFSKGEKHVSDASVAITVDDGYEDTYSVLFPLVKKYNIPFTLFLTTDLSPMKKLGNLPRPTVEQLQEMVDSGLMTIGVHGHSHMNFPEVLEKGLEKEEVENSKEYIETEFGVISKTIAYPAGRYTEEVLEYVKERRYLVGCTTHINSVRIGDDPLLLPRVVVDRKTPLHLFALRLSSGLPVYAQLVHLIKKIV